MATATQIIFLDQPLVMSWQNWKWALPSLFLLQFQCKEFESTLDSRLLTLIEAQLLVSWSLLHIWLGGMGGSGVVRLHASLVLFLVFVNFCLRKKEKRKIRKMLPFLKVFYLKFVPKITICESFCQKFCDFLILRTFLPLK